VQVREGRKDWMPGSKEWGLGVDNVTCTGEGVIDLSKVRGPKILAKSKESASKKTVLILCAT